MSFKQFAHCLALSCLISTLPKSLTAQAVNNSITVVPATPAPASAPAHTYPLFVKETIQLSVPASPVTKFTWKPQSETIATVNKDTGLVTAVAPGKTLIYATDPVTNNQGSIEIDVDAKKVVSISITAPSASIVAGSTTQLSAVSTYTDVEGVTHTESLTSGLSWNLDPTPAANATPIISVAPNGLVTGVIPGTATLSAKYAADSTVTVTPTAGITFTVTPPATSGTLIFSGLSSAGDATVSLMGQDKDVIYLYQFDAAYMPTTHKNQCSSDDLPKGILLSVLSGGAGVTSFNLVGTNPNIIPLYRPLIIGTQICALRTPQGQTTLQGSAFQPVFDPSSYGRLRTYFSSGAVITNQQSTGNSSTANVYVDLDFDYAFIRPGSVRKVDCNSGKPPVPGDKGKRAKPGIPAQTPPCLHYDRGPGLSTFFSTRLSPIPVATSVAGVTSTGAGQAVATTNLNFLSSQQSAHIMLGAYMPFVTTRYLSKSNVFTVGPTIRFGFDTLLNPTLPTASGSATNATVPQIGQIGSFSSVYSFYAGGFRIAWEQFDKSTDQAARTWTELNLTIGQFSNLPSYVCSSSSGLQVTGFTGTPPSVPPSACGTGAFANQHFVSRTNIPRLSLTGKAQFPNYPFVLGIDANLAQYTLGRHSSQVDYLNKAGNDVRIYIGLTFNLLGAINKLNLGF